LETILQRERLIVGGCLAIMVLLAWWYLFRSSATMPQMDVSGMHMRGRDMQGMNMSDMQMHGMVMPDAHQWDLTAVSLLFVMWAVMMIAMMVPSAAPMLLTFLTLNRSRRASGSALAPTGIFLLGYLTVWTAYSAVAALAQSVLHKAALVSSAMALSSPVLGGGLLIAAGVFQWSPVKRACLTSCRSPLSFFMSEWREGRLGAFIMGLRHGLYCLGCCWILMALLFVGGVMNLMWVALLALFVLLEKLVPRGELIAGIAGIALVTVGIALITLVR
jgi:predicted metal-binding membrane protein